MNQIPLIIRGYILNNASIRMQKKCFIWPQAEPSIARFIWKCKNTIATDFIIQTVDNYVKWREINFNEYEGDAN